MVSRKAYRQKKRPGRHRHAKKILLIAVEGKNKTERNYFQYIANSNVDVHIVPGNETDTLSLPSGYRDCLTDAAVSDPLTLSAWDCRILRRHA